VKLTRSLLFVCLLAAAALSASGARAASLCSDDPERCAERGASVRRTIGSVTSLAINVPAPATSSANHKLVRVPPTLARRPAKPVRLAPHSPSAAVTTPGMGMLLKLSGGNSNEISWFPSKPTDSGAGASWIL
jgi:hypothetical protein